MLASFTQRYSSASRFLLHVPSGDCKAFALGWAPSSCSRTPLHWLACSLGPTAGWCSCCSRVQSRSTQQLQKQAILTLRTVCCSSALAASTGSSANTAANYGRDAHTETQLRCPPGSVTDMGVRNSERLWGASSASVVKAEHLNSLGGRTGRHIQNVTCPAHLCSGDNASGFSSRAAARLEKPNEHSSTRMQNVPCPSHQGSPYIASPARVQAMASCFAWRWWRDRII